MEFACALIIAALIAFMLCRTEGFQTKREKATAVTAWFQKNATPSYAKYRHDLGRKSNIVEYEDAMALRKAGTLTVDTAEQIV